MRRCGSSSRRCCGAGKAANPFVKAFEPMAERIAQLGMLNSLAQTVLKLTVPGVPDIYQGCDLWDFSLVDPDNRRPVDYAHRQATLGVARRGGPARRCSTRGRTGASSCSSRARCCATGWSTRNCFRAAVTGR